MLVERTASLPRTGTGIGIGQDAVEFGCGVATGAEFWVTGEEKPAERVHTFVLAFECAQTGYQNLHFSACLPLLAGPLSSMTNARSLVHVEHSVAPVIRRTSRENAAREVRAL